MKIAVIAKPSEFRAFKTFLHNVSNGIEFIRVDHPNDARGVEWAGYIDTCTIRPYISEQIIDIVKTRIR